MCRYCAPCKETQQQSTNSKRSSAKAATTGPSNSAASVEDNQRKRTRGRGKDKENTSPEQPKKRSKRNEKGPTSPLKPSSVPVDDKEQGLVRAPSLIGTYMCMPVSPGLWFCLHLLCMWRSICPTSMLFILPLVVDGALVCCTFC